MEPKLSDILRLQRTDPDRFKKGVRHKSFMPARKNNVLRF